VKGRWRRVLLGVALLLLVAAALGWRRIHFQADVGAGYVAKEVCGCVFVGGRSLESCRPDVPPVMDPVVAELTEDGRGVYARVPLFAWRTAKYDAKTGCTLDAP
jgi:hypothetical protein